MLMRKLFLLLLLLVIAAGAQKTVHVRTYTRQGGTVVQAHTRSAAGAKSIITPKAASPNLFCSKLSPGYILPGQVLVADWEGTGSPDVLVSIAGIDQMPILRRADRARWRSPI